MRGSSDSHKFDLLNFKVAGSKHTSYFYAIFGISLVLFIIGTAAVMLIEAHRISTDFRENLKIEVQISDSLAAGKITSIQKILLEKSYIKNVKLVSKDEALKILKKDDPELSTDFLEYNPLYASFIVNLRENYANKDSFQFIKPEISKIPGVSKVSIQNEILESLDKNIRSASFIILIVAGIILAFAISLIFNTIRLAMFSNRFVIKTMQLFGATRWFIIRPFLGKSIVNGFVGGLISCLIISGLLYYFDRTLPELGLQRDLITFALLSAGIILFGILISFFSTLTAVFRYLRMKVEDLY